MKFIESDDKQKLEMSAYLQRSCSEMGVKYVQMKEKEQAQTKQHLQTLLKLP